MMDGFKDESLLAACSFKESCKKKAEEEEKKRLEALKAEAETQIKDSEEPNEDESKKRKHPACLEGGEDDDEMEDDDELRYLNAMQEQDALGDDDLEHTNPTSDSQQSAPAPLVPSVPPTTLGAALKRHYAEVTDVSEAPAAAALDKRIRVQAESVPVVGGKCGTGKGKGGKGTPTSLAITKGAGKHGLACGVTVSGLSGEGSPTASVRPECSEQLAQEPAGNHCTWKHCKTIESLNLKDGADKDGEVMAPPKSMEKKLQDKWKVEVTKMKPWFTTLVDLFSEDPTVKVNEQNIKTAMTSAKKVTAKVNKRLGYESGTVEEPTFLDRIIKLRTALELAKDLRTLVMKSTKNTITAVEIANSVLKLQECFAGLKENLYVAIPSHWVQAGICYV